MARLARKRRILKWAGLVLSLIIVVQWAVSLSWRWGYSKTTSYPATGWTIQAGSLVYANYLFVDSGISGWVVRYQGTDTEWKPQWEGTPGLRMILLPLWIPFVSVVLLTAFLWWRDRYRIPLHRCQKCGYDLTGNVSGICPEWHEAKA